MKALEEAKIFISYTHLDQQSSTGGDIRQFASDVVDAMEGIHGRTVKLFLDVDDVRWGQNLWNRLDKELQASTFLVPFVTPRYLKSEACRKEFTSFSEAAQRSGSEQLLLPLIWITPSALRTTASSDPIVERLRSTWRIDVSGARKADRGSAGYANLVEEVAQRLEQVIADRESATISTKATAEDEQFATDEPGLDEYLEQAEELMPQAQSDLTAFLGDFTHLGQELKKTFNNIQTQTPAQLRASMVRTGNELREPNTRLTASAGTAASTWDNLITTLNRGLSLYSDVSTKGVPPELVSSLTSMADQLEQVETAELEHIAYQMPKLSSKLAPTSKALLSAVGTIRSMEASVRSWVTAIDENKKPEIPENH